jgi:hypothetical protein
LRIGGCTREDGVDVESNFSPGTEFDASVADEVPDAMKILTQMRSCQLP